MLLQNNLGHTSHMKGVERHLRGGFANGLGSQHTHSLPGLCLALHELEVHEAHEAPGDIHLALVTVQAPLPLSA